MIATARGTTVVSAALRVSTTWGTFALKACPSFTATADANECLIAESLALDLSFVSLTGSLVDLKHGFGFRSGSGLPFWPHVDDSHPIPVYSRGYYFKPTSFIVSDPIILSHNMTMVFYINLKNYGKIVQKAEYFVELNQPNSIFGYKDSLNLIESVVLNNWVAVLFRVYSDIDGNIFASLLSGGIYASFVKIADGIPFDDLDEKLTLGDNGGSFEGFIWKFQIWFECLGTVPDFSLCSLSIKSNCVQDCGLLEVLIGDTCLNCDESCVYGCRNLYDCNLCMYDYCKSCDSFETCEYCGENAHKYQGDCLCDDGFYMDENLICQLCPKLFLEILCLDQCPLGYKRSNKECIERFENGKVLSYVFDKFKLEYQDPVSGVEATFQNVEVSSFEKGIISVYQRGIYLSGNDSSFEFPKKPNKTLMFGLRYYLYIWFNPQTSGHFFEKLNSDSSLIQSTLTSTLSYSVLISSTLQSTSCPVNLSSWQHITYSLSFNSASTLSLHLNTILVSSLTSAGSIKDAPGGSFKFGSSLSFSGFIYSIHLFLKPAVADLLVSFTCESCLICPYAKGCLSNCNITSYNSSIQICESCSVNCSQGCRHSSNCSLCSEPNCLSCDTFESESCTLCASGFGLVSGVCVKCEGKFFYNETSRICQPCKGLCESCENDKVCTSCKAKSSLNEKNECVCDQGFYEHGGCIRRTFEAMIEVNQKNEFVLRFSEELSRGLEIDDLMVRINQNQVKFSIIHKTPTTYKLLIDFQLTAKSNKIFIIFQHKLTSASNSLLGSGTLEAKLYQESGSIYSPLPIIQENTRIVFSCSIGVIAGSSILKFDPNCLYFFLNSVEMFVYTLLFNLTVDLELKEFLMKI